MDLRILKTKRKEKNDKSEIPRSGIEKAKKRNRRGKKNRDSETHQKRFRDYEIGPNFSETHVFRRTIPYPYLRTTTTKRARRTIRNTMTTTTTIAARTMGMKTTRATMKSRNTTTKTHRTATRTAVTMRTARTLLTTHESLDNHEDHDNHNSQDN